jgi:hypothetical protein
MHFSVDQPLQVPRAVAEQALVDPSFYSSMGDTGAIGTPEVLERHELDGGAVRMQVRYRLTAHLAPPVRAVLDPEKLTWVIESTMHPERHAARFRMLPDHYADRLDCAGSYRFEERGAERSAQVTEGDLVVHFPLVAGAVERAILAGLRQHMSEHAAHVERWAAARG